MLDSCGESQHDQHSPQGRQGKMLDTTAEVETPEHVVFRFQVAGPARRMVAYVVDLLVRALIALVLLIPLFLSVLGTETELMGAELGIFLVALFLLEWGYYVFFETLMGGRSLGKLALGLRVVRQDGRPLSIGDSLLRNLLRAADFLPMGYALGVLIMGFDPIFRRLGDWVAGTMVVSESRRAQLSKVEVEPAPSVDELATLPARVDLRGPELDAIELFLRRQSAISVARRKELADLIAPAYAQRLDVDYDDPVRFLSLLYYQATLRRT